MENQEITFDNAGIIRSETFDDIYFDPEDALGEIDYNFLLGNRLPERWTDTSHLTIGETGFGTGLNFLRIWQLFEEQPDDKTLHFVSVEKYPLSPQQLAKALAPFHQTFGHKIDQLLENYPLRIKGAHRLRFSESVTVTLIFDDAADGLSQIDGQIDAWFLDGFAPSKNKDIWRPDVYRQMARLSYKETTLATFTAAGFVRRGLEEAGFIIEKTDGFKNKRERIIGQYSRNSVQTVKDVGRVAIIGAGLAGAAAAYALASRGIDVDVYDQADHPASQASGNEIGLINPKPSVGPTVNDHLSLIGYDLLLRQIKQFINSGKKIRFNQYGNLHLLDDETKEQKYKKLIHSGRFHPDHMQLISPKIFEEMTGLKTECESVLYPNAGTCSPSDLVTAYLDHPRINCHFNKKIEDIDNIDYSNMVIACGIGAEAVLPNDNLGLETVRGQTTTVQLNSDIQVPHGISYGGYITPTDGGNQCVIGSTYDHDRDEPVILKEDDKDNLQKLIKAFPQLEGHVEQIDNWAGVRVTTKHRSPLFGHLRDNIFLSLALGSHGMVLSIAIAELIADQITGTVTFDHTPELQRMAA